MNIVICDDDDVFRITLEKHLRTYFNERSIPLNFIHFSCGEELLGNTMLFDLVFLDVEMGKINGIDAGKQLKSQNPHSIIFVITSYEGYLDDAFKINAFRFLQKPLNVVRLYKALDDSIELINNDIIVFYDMKSSSNIRIYSNDIIFIEIEKKKTKIVTVNDIYYSNEKNVSMEKQIKWHFFCLSSFKFYCKFRLFNKAHKNLTYFSKKRFRWKNFR